MRPAETELACWIWNTGHTWLGGTIPWQPWKSGSGTSVNPRHTVEPILTSMKQITIGIVDDHQLFAPLGLMFESFNRYPFWATHPERGDLSAKNVCTDGCTEMMLDRCEHAGNGRHCNGSMAAATISRRKMVALSMNDDDKPKWMRRMLRLSLERHPPWWTWKALDEIGRKAITMRMQ